MNLSVGPAGEQMPRPSIFFRWFVACAGSYQRLTMSVKTRQPRAFCEPCIVQIHAYGDLAHFSRRPAFQGLTTPRTTLYALVLDTLFMAVIDTHVLLTRRKTHMYAIIRDGAENSIEWKQELCSKWSHFLAMSETLCKSTEFGCSMETRDWWWANRSSPART